MPGIVLRTVKLYGRPFVYVHIRLLVTFALSFLGVVAWSTLTYSSDLSWRISYSPVTPWRVRVGYTNLLTDLM